MAGLLDIDMNTPEGQGFNSALMRAAAMLLTPRAQGGGMGAAFAAMPQEIQRAQEQAMRQRTLGMQEQQLGLQTQEMQRKAQAQALQQQNLQRWVESLPPEQRLAAMVAPEKFAESLVPQQSKLETIFDDQGREVKAWMRPGAEPVPVGGAKQPQMPWEYETGPDGQPRMRPGVLAAKTQVGRASAPSMEVKVENKMGESVGQQVGPMLKAGREQTIGALNLGRSGEAIISAIDGGQVIAGPGAKWRLFGAQVADLLGVGGKDNAEKLQNTRRVVRGLADAAVEARKRLAGQGQVTENEAKAVEKASSGSIEDLTVDEIKLIANLNVKAARMAARDYASQLDAMPPEMSGARPFYAIPGLEQWAVDDSTPAAPALPSGWSVQRVK
ncbi:MAG: hypothetical protein LT106_18545 [Burkholderiaceae bacterium]|nr:hypothetical protein [Burkholderiaceae bacterium]